MVDEHLKEKKLRDLQFDQIEREVDKRIDKMKSVLEHKEATIDELRSVTKLLKTAFWETSQTLLELRKV